MQSEWLDELKNMTADDIKRGLDTWHEPWPPNVFEFSNACKDQSVKAFNPDPSLYKLEPGIMVSEEKAKENIKRFREAIVLTGVVVEQSD